MTRATRTRTRRTIRAFAATSACLLVTGVLTVVLPTVLPPGPFTVQASGAGCLDDNGHEVTCPISLNPNPLPIGTTIGEQELTGFFGSAGGATQVQPYEWLAGSTPGKCLPNDAACSLSSKLRAGSPVPDQSKPAEWPSAPGMTGPASGDTAITAGDLNGDGRDETISAATCPSAAGSSTEICLSVYNPATNGYPKAGQVTWFHTGQDVDTEGVGTIRLAEGLLVRKTAAVTRAVFTVNDGADPAGDPIPQGGILATFTTRDPHGYVPGQPLRFADDPDLAEAMCPALSQGSVLCGADLSADWLPVLSVPTPTTFTLRIGVAFEEAPPGGGDDTTTGPVVPDPWPVLPQLGTLGGVVEIGQSKIEVIENGSAPVPPFDIFVDSEQMRVTARSQVGGSSAYNYTVTRTSLVEHSAGAVVSQACTACELEATGVGPGLAMAWDAPGRTAKLATFSVRMKARNPVRLIDDAPVGRLATNAVSATADGSNSLTVSGRDALDLAVDDFDGDGQDEAAVVWAGQVSSVDLGLVRFYGVSEGKQLTPLSDARPWDAVNAKAPYSVSTATGFFSAAQGTNTLGQDLAIGWGGRGHAFEVFDVTRDFQVRNVGLDNSSSPRVLQSGGKPAQWKPGTNYAAGDIVQDPLGFWEASQDGKAACTQDVPDATTFYFPKPGASTSSPLAALPETAGWDLRANRQAGLKVSDPTTAGSELRGLLDPGPPTVTAAVAPEFLSPLPVPKNVLHGQYVSPALAEQNITSTSVRMLMQGAWSDIPIVGPATDQTFPKLAIRVVSHDGSIDRGTLYSNLSVPISGDEPYAKVSTWTNSQGDSLKAGTTRRFAGTESGNTPLTAVHAQVGDRLVVEFGTRAEPDPTGRADEIVWAGTPAGQDLPNDTTTRGGLYNPHIDFTKPLVLDNCADHFADTSSIVWKRVTVPDHVTTWDPSPHFRSLAEPNDWPTALEAAGHSAVRLASGDLDMDGVDEVVFADARTAPLPGQASAAPALSPMQIQVWTQDRADCAVPASPGAADACPSPQGLPSRVLLAKAAASTVGGQLAGRNDILGSGQLSIGVGRVGSSDTQDVTFPNGVNPDVVLAWTCAPSGIGQAQRCGSARRQIDGPVQGSLGVAVQAFDVCVVGTDQDGDGVDDVCATNPGGGARPWQLTSPGAAFTHARTPATSGPGVDWGTTNFVLPDIDRDSKTLGTPLEYLETGHVQPLLIVRSPPVHFDAFDTSTNGEPGTGPDGKVDPTEVWDVNNCFTDYLATGEDYTCHTTASYGTSTTVSSTLHGEVTNSNTTAGAGTVGVGVGAAVLGKCARSSGDVHVTDISTSDPKATATGAACIEGSAFLKLSGSESQTASGAKDVGRSFTYTSTVTTSAGTDAVYAAVQQSEVLEYPVYAGSGFGFGSGTPIEYVTTKTPLRTRFQWNSSEDFNLPLTGQGHVAQNILSYARSEDQLKSKTPKNGLLSATPMDGGTWVKAAVKDAPNFACAQNATQPSNDVTPISIRGTDTWGKIKDGSGTTRSEYPCAVGDVPVELQDTHSVLDRTYLVSQFLDSTTLRLEPTVPIPTGAGPISNAGALLVAPGIFPVDEWRVRRFHKLEAELVTNTESGFESSYGWSFGAGLEAGLSIDAAFSGGILGGFTTFAASLNLEFSTDYTHNELQTVSIGTTQETRFAVEVTGNIKPNISYTIKPYLMQSPTGAMVLDWTTSPNSVDTFWNKFYVKAGPNPGFSLPDLMTPYKAPAPNSKPGATVPLLLRSPDFGGWNCQAIKDPQTQLTSYTDCVPRAAAEPEEPLFLVATVHNYSLATYDKSTPLKIRFYVGDPARGGYQIITSKKDDPLSDPLGVDVPSVRSKQCVSRFCLPAQGESTVRVPWDWTQSNPGLAGRGTPADPLPIYAIVDAANKVTPEVHDFTAPVEVHRCTATYPTIANEYNSECPTTDNEAWFTQGFAGSTQLPTDLNVTRPGDVQLNSDNSVQVTVHAPPGTGRVQVRLYACTTGGTTCVPQTLASLRGTRTILDIGPSGSASVRFPALTPGTWKTWVQVVPIDRFEVPGGGPFDEAGTLANNQVRTVLKAP